MIRVSCLLFDGFVLLDMAGPITAFETASQCDVSGYSIEILGSTTGSVTSSSGALSARLISERPEAAISS
jgi:transcriptional regulator GlxA family with amidase domain